MRSKIGILMAAALTVACSLATATTFAQATTRFNLPAQSLADSLRAVAGQTNSNILFDRSLVAGLSARPLKADLSTDEALRQLLAGTGLTYQNSDEKTVMIVPANKSTNTSPSLSVLEERGRGEEPSRSKKRGPFNWLRLTQSDTAQSDPPAQSDSSSTDSRATPALEEVVVTAEKRTESIQSLPISIMAFSGETLEDQGIDDISNLQLIAPSLQGAFDQHIPKVSIRGVGHTINSNLSAEAGVAIMQDGLPYGSALMGGVDFFDLERLEVLRGPQGTISGRNATAGAIHLYSKRPTEDIEGGVKAVIGNYNRLGVDGYLSGPIIGDRLLARLAVRADRADGWVTNTALNQELGTIDERQARLSFLTRLGETFEAHLVLEALRDQSQRFIVEAGRVFPDTPSLAEFAGSRSFDWDAGLVEHDQQNDYDVEKYRVTLNLDWDLGSSARLAATIGYVDYWTKVTRELDGTTFPAITRHPDGEVYEASQISQEVTLTANLTDRLDMILGGLYLDVSQAGGGTSIGGGPIGLPPLGIPLSLGGIDTLRHDHDLTSLAAYTQWRYRLTDTLRLTAGVRYTHDSKDYVNQSSFLGTPSSTQSVDDSWSAWTPRIAVDYAPREDVTLYASAARGFKSGGFSSSPTEAPFNPEFVWNYEVGVKSQWLDGRLNAALTGFFMDYTDLQQRVIIFDPIVGITARTINANSATNKGVELELDALVTDRLRLTFAGTWLDATFDELVDRDDLFPELGAPLPGAPPGSPNVRDLSGNRLERAPQWQLNFFGEYRAPLGATFLGAGAQGVLRWSYAWQDDIYFSHYNYESESQEAYGFVNLSGGIETGDGKRELSVYVRNLTDEEYYSLKYADAAGALFPAPNSGAIPGWPRTYGVSFAYRF